MSGIPGQKGSSPSSRLSRSGPVNRSSSQRATSSGSPPARTAATARVKELPSVSVWVVISASWAPIRPEVSARR